MRNLLPVIVVLSTFSPNRETEALDSSVYAGSLWLIDTKLMQVGKRLLYLEKILHGKLRFRYPHSVNGLWFSGCGCSGIHMP